MAEVIPYHDARPGIRPADARIGQRDDPMGAEPQPGKVISMTVVYLVQHGDKQPGPVTGADGAGPDAGHPDRPAAGRPRDRCPVGQPDAARAGNRRVHRRGDRARGAGNARLRERLNWDGSMPWEAFADLWARTAEDRDLVPGGGQSAREAGARLQEFLAGLRGLPGPVAAVTHGGVTAELLRTLLGDDAPPIGALAAGIPPCAITTWMT